jgi:hypothetical protein
LVVVIEGGPRTVGPFWLFFSDVTSAGWPR